VRLVHALDGRTRDPDVVGLRGSRLAALASLDLAIAPGFVIGTGAWHLARLLGGAGLPVTVSEQLTAAAAGLAGAPRLSVSPAPVASDHAAEAAVRVDGGDVERIEAATRRLLHAAVTPVAVIVQACGAADPRPPSGTGIAFTRDPLSGAVWPSGEFRTGDAVMDLDAFSRRLPEAGIELRRALARIESLHRAVCEVRFTLVGGRLFFDDAKPAPPSARSAGWLAEAGLVEPRPVTPRSPGVPGS
jgi:hypothetical protein